MRVATLALLVLSSAAGPQLLGQSSVQYAGGTAAEFGAGTQGMIELTDAHYFAFYTKKAQVRVPYDQINLIEYGQQVSRRIAAAIALSALVPAASMLAFTKSRKHYLTVGYTGEDGKQQAMVFRVGKNNIRVVLVSLEARTGLKIEYQDEEARKAGKG